MRVQNLHGLALSGFPLGVACTPRIWQRLPLRDLVTRSSKSCGKQIWNRAPGIYRPDRIAACRSSLGQPDTMDTHPQQPRRLKLGRKRFIGRQPDPKSSP
jgi:hypothetical protein